MKVAKTFRLDTETVKVLERAAEQQNRTLSNMVETILKEKVDELRKKMPRA